MSLLYFFRRLYALDTLDTRFTYSSKTPIQATNTEHDVDTSKPAAANGGSATSQTRALANTQPSRWNTPEYYIYYLVFLVAVPLMFYVPYSVSKGHHVIAPFLYQRRHADIGAQSLIHSIPGSSHCYRVVGSQVAKW